MLRVLFLRNDRAMLSEDYFKFKIKEMLLKTW
jgi:hypothetical protein